MAERDGGSGRLLGDRKEGGAGQASSRARGQKGNEGDITGLYNNDFLSS